MKFLRGKRIKSKNVMMEQKIWELQKAVKCIQAVLVRTDGKPDWDDVADIIKKMEADQGADERHMYAVSQEAYEHRD